MDHWHILVEDADNGLTMATVLEIPDIKTTDKTKQGAVEKIRQLLKNRLAKTEMIQIAVPTKSIPEKNPLMKFAGIFEDDPDFQEIIAEIKAEQEDDNEI